MVLFGEPLSTFVPGLLFIAVVVVLAFGVHRRRQASPIARRVQARGWRFNEDRDIEGPLPAPIASAPASGFRARAWSGLAWADRQYLNDDNTLAGCEFRAWCLPAAGASAGAAVWRPRADSRGDWQRLFEQVLRQPMRPEQFTFECTEAALRLQVDGIDVADTDALIVLAERCLVQLAEPALAAVAEARRA